MAYFDPGSVIWALKSTDKYDAIREVVSKARAFAKVPGLEVDEFAELVIRREKLQSTGFGHGVAVAHGRTERVSEPVIALGVSREGIEFGAVDGEPVHLLFIVANHPDHQMNYLRILSSLVAMVREKRFREEILTCRRADEAEQKLCGAFEVLLQRHQSSSRSEATA